MGTQLSAQHRYPGVGRRLFAPVTLALGLALTLLTGALPAHADQWQGSWSSQIWSPRHWSHQNWPSQNWSQNNWPRNWSKSQWKDHADWRHRQQWQQHQPRFHNEFRPCFGCGSRFVFSGPRFNGIVLFSSPGFAVVRPGFVHRRQSFAVRQPGFVNLSIFARRHPSLQPVIPPLAPAIRIIRPGMNNSGVRFIRPGD